MHGESRKRIEEVLDGMDAMDREILTLRYFEELSSAEAAQSLGIKEGTARQRFLRARKRLKSVLEDEKGGK